MAYLLLLLASSPGAYGGAPAVGPHANAQRRVLLLEAGQNFTPDDYPAVLTDANVVAGSPTFDWHYHTEDAARLGHDIPVPRSPSASHQGRHPGWESLASCLLPSATGHRQPGRRSTAP